MHRKDYQAIAKAIAKSAVLAKKTNPNYTVTVTDTINTVIIEVADILKEDNPNFDKDRFFDYLYNEVEKIESDL